jgi:sugar phosphate isomerase/epimerase
MMKLAQIAAQMYSVREFLKTPADIKKSLVKVKKIGYQAVQLSGLGPIADSELTRILNGEGLVCCATHEPSDMILNEPNKAVDHLKAIGCTATAYPFPRGIKLSNMREVKAFAKSLDKAGGVFHKAGLELSYHNHDIEFVRVDGKLVLDLLMELTSPDNLKLELDTYWAQAGGSNPVEICKRYKGRMPLIHIKDYGMTPERKPVFEEIGSGNLNWPELLKAAEASKSKWFIVEQDANFEGGNPFKSLAMSFEFLKANFAK